MSDETKISKDIVICGTFKDDDGVLNVSIEVNGSGRSITKEEAEKLIEVLQKLITND
jgi:hypothetical protein